MGVPPQFHVILRELPNPRFKDRKEGQEGFESWISAGLGVDLIADLCS
jgi:hypothetical protein